MESLALLRSQVAILEPNEQAAPLHADFEPVDAAPRQSPAGRFVYAADSRPLKGFTIRRGVGHGGFGEIYYATSDAGKDVALKLIRRNLDVELRGIRQCLNLKHPNLLDIYDIRQDERGDTWVVMEYVAEPSLEAVLDARPAGLPPHEALRWIRGIGAGVAYLHERGIVHRDLKPGNIFCDQGVVKVGDYGLSKFISSSRRSGHTESIGTVHYMAPEVANGRYGTEIDVYALGVILYELLTGRVPFEGESVGEILMKHLTARPDVSMLAEPYRSVVARALEKDPALRYRSAGEMLAALPTGRAGEAPAAPNAGRASEDPILRGARRAVQRVRLAVASRHARRHRDDGDDHARKFLFVIAIIAIVMFPPVVLMLPALAILYGVYRLLLAWTTNSREPTIAGIPVSAVEATKSPAIPAATAAVVNAHGWAGWREKAVQAMIVKPVRERLAELARSLVISALTAAAVCLAMVLIESYRTNTANMPRPEQFAWLLGVSIAGSWAVLVPSKFWEGVRGDAVLRRFLMMVIGMGVGAVAFGLSQWLMASLPPAAGYPAPLDYTLPLRLYAADGRPLLMAHVACFGTLFLLVRWWRQADPLRRTRLRLWTVLWCIVLAGIVAFAWHFPQPWLPMAAGAISVSVQLASPWLDPRRGIAGR
jgi:hypothetical protein